MSVLAYPPTNEKEIFRQCTKECGIIKTTEDQQYFSLGCTTCSEKFLYFGGFVEHIQTRHASYENSTSSSASARSLKRRHDVDADLAEVHRPLLDTQEVMIKEETYEIVGHEGTHIVNEPLLNNYEANADGYFSVKHERTDQEICMEIGHGNHMSDSLGSFNNQYSGEDDDGDRSNNCDETDFDELVEESLLDYIKNSESKGKVENHKKEHLYRTLQSIDNKNYKYVYALFKDHGIDEKHLMLLTPRHLSEIFPKDAIGVRIELEKKIRDWQKNKLEEKACNIITKSNDVIPSISSATLGAISTNESPKIEKVEKVVRRVVLKDIINRELSEAKDNYIINGSLTELDKRKLSSAIIKYFEHENIKQTSTLLEDVATQINTIFPTESNESWYCKSPGKRVRGRLVSKKYNVRRNILKKHISDIFPKQSMGVKVELEKNIKDWQKNKDKENACNIIAESYDVIPSISAAALSAIPTDESPQITKIEKVENVVRRVVLNDIIKRELSEAKDNYMVNGSLTELDKRKLSSAIIRYFEHKNIKQTSILLEDVATQINIIFPTESNESWYCKTPGKRVKGRLVSKKYNVRRNSLKKPSTSTQMINEDFNDDDSDTNEVADADFMAKIDWLKMNESNTNEILKVWSDTSRKRTKDIKRNVDDNLKNVIDIWPSYKLPIGHLLIEIDFKTLFPMADIKTYERWQIFQKKIVDFYKIHIKDAKANELLFSFLNKESSLSQDSRNAILLYLLPAIIKPSSIKTNKKMEKFSIAESQQHFIKTIKCTRDQDMYEDEQPYIFVAGDSLFDITAIHVRYNGISYKCVSIINAIATCFHLFMVFNVKYPCQAIDVWTFVQNFFYDIYLKTDSFSSISKTIITYLKFD